MKKISKKKKNKKANFGQNKEENGGDIIIKKILNFN